MHYFIELILVNKIWGKECGGLEEIFFFTSIAHNNITFAANITDHWFYKGMQRKNSFEPRAELFLWGLFCSGSSLLGRKNNFSPHQPHALHVTSWYPDLTQENIWDSNTAFNLMPSFILVKWFLLRIPTPLNWITWIEYWHSWCLYLGYFFALTSPLLPSCYCIPGCCKVETECYW